MAIFIFNPSKYFEWVGQRHTFQGCSSTTHMEKGLFFLNQFIKIVPEFQDTMDMSICAGKYYSNEFVQLRKKEQIIQLPSS